MGKHQALSPGDEALAGSSLNEWNINPDPATLDFHLKQWDEPYRSTVHFSDFLADRLEIAGLVVDIGCGSGAPAWYLADRFPGCKFIGIDVSRELIAHARRHRNLEFELDDVTNLRVRFGVSGVVCMQALHTLPNAGIALHQVSTRIRPDWIAFSTLIYEGNINCRIVVEEPARPRQSYYNVFGWPLLVTAMKMEGYHPVKYQPFKIDMDLPKPDNPDLMGTYTLMTEAGSRLQCSGPLLMPWGFCLFERRK